MSRRAMRRTHAKTLAMVRAQAYREIDISCHLDEEMAAYADSLNHLPPGSPLPAFLFNKCFDWSNRLCWPGFHNPISLRQIVVSKVTDKLVIERILKNDDSCFLKVCSDRDLLVPDAEKSWRELFSLRYAELN
jgi:hypothetical protein